jgi:hypothetical protein
MPARPELCSKRRLLSESDADADADADAITDGFSAL